MSTARPSIANTSAKEFPPFRLDTVNECLWRHRDAANDERILLPPKAFDMLRYLVEHAGRLVTQDELLEALWPDTFVQPEVLKSHLRDIRIVLGDDCRNPRFIETLPRRGYQFVAPVSDAPTTTEFALELPSPKIVGRNTQLDELHSCLRKAFGNQRQVVFVTGETGIGKTTLVDEFLRRAAAAFPGIRMARGQCVEGFGGKEAYYPILEAVSQLCGGPGGDAIVQALSTEAPTWLVQFPALVSNKQREELQQKIVGSTRERMLREIGEVLETITSDKPLLLVLEDLHCADTSTVDFISTLARRRARGKLMLIGTYRPVDMAFAQHPLKAVKQDLLVHQLCREIALEPLTEVEVAEYLALEAAGGAVPEGLARLIYRHSEGNPMFMVAALDHMREQGLITIESGTWQIKVPLETIELQAPESLRQLIELQIERLSEEEQRALEVASVSGVSFTAHADTLGSAGDREKFENLCEKLSRRQHMVRRAGSHQFPDGTISQCYEFAHALYREVFYRRQAPARRAKLQWICNSSVACSTAPA
jgi:predicted ATPase/DNA-binding winged helix-turn-helix (wHTH) protein